MGLAGWLALGSALTLLSMTPGALGRWCGHLADQLTPLLVRRVLTVALGTSTVSLALPPASVVGTAAAPTRVGPALPTVVDRAQDPAGQPERGPSDGRAVDLSRPSTAPGPGYHPTGGIVSGDDALAGTALPGYRPTGGLEPSVEPRPGYQPTPESSPRPRATASTSASPGFRPTRPVAAHDRAGSSLLAPTPRPDVAALDTVTVRRGDSLWTIAERHLGAAASDAEVARAWPRWYAANRTVIGDDPDLIRPGMQLVPPREGDLR
jgi:nucleoid-associated protein YgaU